MDGGSRIEHKGVYAIGPNQAVKYANPIPKCPQKSCSDQTRFPMEAVYSSFGACQPPSFNTTAHGLPGLDLWRQEISGVESDGGAVTRQITPRSPPEAVPPHG